VNGHQVVGKRGHCGNELVQVEVALAGCKLFSASLSRGRIVASARARHLKDENARYLSHAVSELKHIQSASSDIKQKPLNIHNSVRKGRVVFNLGHEVSSSLEKSFNCARPGNKDLFHR
jgi:hypothetical protein